MRNSTEKKYIGDYLIEAGIINEVQLQEALSSQKKMSKQGNVELLGQTLVDLGYCEDEDIMLALAMKSGVPFMILDDNMIDEKAGSLMTHEMMERYQAFPVGFEGEKLLVAMLRPTDIIAIDDLNILTGYDIQPIIIPDFQLQEALEREKTGFGEKDFKHPSLGEQDKDNKIEVEVTEADIGGDVEVIDDTNERPAVQLANMIFNQAVQARASDVHIEPYETSTRIRFRIDGVLHEIMSPSKQLHPSLVSRLKVMANMDIAERRVPQDGRITLLVNSETIDIRVSSIPTAYGEKLTLRLLNRSEKVITLPELGFPDDQLAMYNEIMKLPHGFILVTGPTGSGKSTTLYATLVQLNSVDKNIITIEDPIERRLDGINQSQINIKAGMTFVSSLRAFLRSDPDIMMVGEIRDYETARIAIESALTGHLVLSTLHTNHAAGAITRLDDMGIEPFLIASSLVGVIAQRLVRVLCPHCKENYRVDREELLKSFPDFPVDEGMESIPLYRAKSCHQCNYTGYRGRVGIYELLPISESVKKLILNQGTDGEIKDMAIEEGMVTIRQHAMLKVKEGVTSIG
ncbi:MAG TPA: ATPase, T2SS/T4P/T4SS family, partial [Clostridia bacterium]|nr:ATPase, T2SS/T4P/T4SS family [Clostridia bacterium]